MIKPKDYKISNLNTQILILLIISSCFTFCTTKKNINNADYLLEKVIIEDKYSGIEKTEIEKFKNRSFSYLAILNN